MTEHSGSSMVEPTPGFSDRREFQDGDVILVEHPDHGATLGIRNSATNGDAYPWIVRSLLDSTDVYAQVAHCCSDRWAQDGWLIQRGRYHSLSIYVNALRSSLGWVEPGR